MSLREKIAEFFGLRKSMVALLAMVILVGLGEKMAERFLPIYLMALGGGAITIGLLNAMTNLLSALYSFPGGYLSDRLGYKKALLGFQPDCPVWLRHCHFLPLLAGSACRRNIFPFLVGNIASRNHEPCFPRPAAG